MIEPVSLVTADGLTLEAEVARSNHEIARVVLCHPHPLQGGTMRSLVISELFRVLPEAGFTCLRFNFRGVGGSDGTHAAGVGERSDALAAVRWLTADVPIPCFVVGWSFGGDVALSVHDSAIAGWIGIAPPLRFAADLDEFVADPRPKLLILAEHDEVRAPADVLADAESWAALTVEVVPGASHFFIGRTDRLATLARSWLTARVRP
ncbi:MAG: alpha/beta fold hydrolase [Acidimicrobiia bacterium]